MNWLRRLLAPPSQRGTLTLLDHGLVIGAPADWTLTPREATVLKDLLDKWLAEKSVAPLVLPWPVDVVDLRGQMYERTK